MQGVIQRPTMDLDVAAQKKGKRWKSQPLPPSIVDAIREVAVALDLPRVPRDDRDWLNTAPSFLLKLGLPRDFERRSTTMNFGALKLHIAGRFELICLKLLAATASDRTARRQVDLADLQALAPTHREMGDALAWCARLDGRPDFVRLEAAGVLLLLGFNAREFVNE